MRLFIRHKIDIPISFKMVNFPISSSRLLKNYSEGGVCFIAHHCIEPGSDIQLFIPALSSEHCAEGIVAWCRSVKDGFELGVKFNDKNSAFTVRMVEQLCHIDNYRRTVEQTEGRKLSGEDAALEWIKNHAGTFPSMQQ